MDDVVLNPQIFEKELDGMFVVRLDSAHLCGSNDNDIGLFLGEKFGNGRFIREIKLRASAHHDVAKPFGFKPAQHCAADHPTMAGNKNLVGLVHRVHSVKQTILPADGRYRPLKTQGAKISSTNTAHSIK